MEERGGGGDEGGREGCPNFGLEVGDGRDGGWFGRGGGFVCGEFFGGLGAGGGNEGGVGTGLHLSLAFEISWGVHG